MVNIPVICRHVTNKYAKCRQKPGKPHRNKYQRKQDQREKNSGPRQLVIEDELRQQQHGDANGGMEQGGAQGNPWQDFQWKDNFFYVIDIGQDQRRSPVDAFRK